MPTHDEADEFWRDWHRLTPGQQAAFRRAVAKLVHDLKHGSIRKGLRVKRFHRVPDTWEMTWADDGRALFRYGESIRPGDPHVIWMRIGSHDVFDES